MSSRNNLAWRLLAVGTALTTLPAAAAADDVTPAGYHRISAQPLPPVAIPAPTSTHRPVRWAGAAAASPPGSSGAVQPAGFHHGVPHGSSAHCPTCPAGYAASDWPSHRIEADYHLMLGPKTSMHQVLEHCCCHSCLLKKHKKGCNHSPDYGWAPPADTPVLRVPITYQRYWPEYWTGEARPETKDPVPVFPMIYMPTDTAQLGYSYHQAPAWQPNAAMLPNPPWPAAWHCRNCPTYRSTVSHAPTSYAPVRAVSAR